MSSRTLLAFCLSLIGINAFAIASTAVHESTSTAERAPAISGYEPSITERLLPPLVGAHQGGIFKLKPNTIEQFKEAIETGVDILEMDLRPTADGEVVVFHNEDLGGMTSNCRGPVSKKTYTEISHCRLRISGLKIPSFREVLQFVNGRVVINAEFKVEEVAAPAIKLIEEFNAYEWVYFQTKASAETYLHARSLDSRVALLFKAKRRENLDWAISQNDPRLIVIEMEKEMATPENLAIAHSAGKLVSVNSWRYAKLQEIASAGCTKVFKRGIDIAICNNLASCVKQRKDFE